MDREDEIADERDRCYHPYVFFFANILIVGLNNRRQFTNVWMPAAGSKKFKTDLSRAEKGNIVQKTEDIR
jgi:hypothetical protein